MKTFLNSALLLTSIFISACHGTNINVNNLEASVDTSGIINGALTTKDQDITKSVVGLVMTVPTQITNPQTHRNETVNEIGRCTGAIISNDTVLTAAHCFVGSSSAIVVFADNLDEKNLTKKNTRKITLVPMIHKDYSGKGTNLNDIAIAHFEGGLPQGYKAIEVAKKSELTMMHQLTLIGFGLTDDRNHDSGGVLHFSKKAIFEIYHPEKQIEIDQKDKGICMGDSGGPALIRSGQGYKVAGINSFVYNPESENMPCRNSGVLTNATEFTDWIESSTKILEERAQKDRGQ